MDKVLKILGKIFLLVMVVIQLIPFYIVLTTACKARTDLTSKWIPAASIYWENFENALTNGNMLVAIKNTFIITGGSVILIVIIGSLAAYPLARIQSKTNKFIMFFIVGMMMVPPLSILVPLYSMLNQIGAINTYWGIICVMVTGQLPFAVFLFKNFISTIPEALDEAAYIDGAGFMRTYFQIIMPLVKPVISSVVIITGTFIWNDYQLSLYIIPKSDMRNVATSVAQFFSQQTSNMGAAAAAALIGMLPIVIVYIVLQKQFIKGMVDSAVK